LVARKRGATIPSDLSGYCCDDLVRVTNARLVAQVRLLSIGSPTFGASIVSKNLRLVERNSHLPYPGCKRAPLPEWPKLQSPALGR
jgi:hypothetical protein